LKFTALLPVDAISVCNARGQQSVVKSNKPTMNIEKKTNPLQPQLGGPKSSKKVLLEINKSYIVEQVVWASRDDGDNT
jgi:hypothetical protein